MENFTFFASRRRRSLIMPLLLSFVFAILSLFPLVQAANPEVTITRLENLPNRLYYFDDTPVRLSLLYPMARVR